ncbi:3-phenylpropionate/cinnamic acid dioxygenase subunit beta [Dactylosporangium sp. CA-233914]|uniref:3-phenylpropionate/cinnamic acid dioxygenase subunit beta n=1 Tax=Dactylosporangium sp. CA-233914 TaxID=3239934 RepID=UPI003D8C110C
MTETGPAATEALARMLLQYRVEQFYYDEAAILDRHAYDEWVQLFTDDTHYFMPIRRTMLRRNLAKEFTQPGEMAFFDDNKQMLEARAVKFATGKAWAEDPPSRTRHIITNVRITEQTGDELHVESNFLLYRTRLKSEEDQWIGSRRDVLRTSANSFQIAKRTILLEQTVLLSRNLSNMF